MNSQRRLDWFGAMAAILSWTSHLLSLAVGLARPTV